MALLVTRMKTFVQRGIYYVCDPRRFNIRIHKEVYKSFVPASAMTLLYCRYSGIYFCSRSKSWPETCLGGCTKRRALIMFRDEKALYLKRNWSQIYPNSGQGLSITSGMMTNIARQVQETRNENLRSFLFLLFSCRFKCYGTQWGELRSRRCLLVENFELTQGNSCQWCAPSL